ncbi:MAG TPA: DNA-binding protein [Candidatus Nanoarchaeia archaeon]|nr:DNA-binding protein [Candidatus Nanoarchaeia archaeon]
MNDYNDYQEQFELRRKIGALENLVKSYLSKEAILRYSNIKAAYPEKQIQILEIMKNLIQTGRIKKQLSDDEFKEILRLLQTEKKEFKIRRI